MIDKNCLDDNSWKKIKPLGMNINLIANKALDGKQISNFTLELEHVTINKKIKINLFIPIFDKNVINWRNSKKALLFKGDLLIDSDFEIDMNCREESERMDVHITSPYDLAIKGMEKSIASGIRNWFYDFEKELNDNVVQTYIDKWFSSNEQWRVLKYSRIAQEDQHNGIILNLMGKDSSHSRRMMNKVFNAKLWDIIDLNSTSVSDKINESFRFINGVYFKNKNFKSLNTLGICCKTLVKHSIGLGMNPKRAYLLKNTFEQTVDLVSPDFPLVHPYKKDEENILHGKNFLTAIMHLEHYTHEDAIAISENAAKEMIAARTITQLIESNLPITLLIQKDDTVSQNTVIALDGDKEIRASKLYYPGKIVKIVLSKGNRFGVNTNRVWLEYESYYPLSNGDKLSNRHGGKGVITIIPNKSMPHTKNNTIIDICIGPETITNRKAMSILWEMMLTKKAIQQGENLYVKLLKDSPELAWTNNKDYDFKTLSLEYGNKEQLYVDNKPLECLTYVSKLFWLRLDKFAKEIITSIGDKQSYNNFNSVTDNAKLSGQRCNVAKLLALSAKNLQNLATEIVDENISGEKFFSDLINATYNEDFIVKNIKI